jgi:gluconokinase
MAPGAHGLTVLPLFAGERSPNWRADARAAITGVSVHTTPLDILRASLEAVALRFRIIYEMMVTAFGVPVEVITSGGALLHSPVWTQIMADVLGRPIRTCLEPEATSRGAALLALERLGMSTAVTDSKPRLGREFNPKPEYRAIYDLEFERQQTLYRKLFEES